MFGVVTREVAPTLGRAATATVAEEFAGMFLCCHRAKKHTGEPHTIPRLEAMMNGFFAEPAHIVPLHGQCFIEV